MVGKNDTLQLLLGRHCIFVIIKFHEANKYCMITVMVVSIRTRSFDTASASFGAITMY